MSEPLTADPLEQSAAAGGSQLVALPAQHVRMSLAPLPTVTALTLEAVGERRGSPVSWCRAVRAALDPDDVALLRPVTAGGLRYIPDCLVPRPPSFAPTFEEQLEHVATTPADVVAADLAAENLFDSPWAPMDRHPRRWLAAYAAAMRRAWVAVRPLWDRATPLLESEVDRVGAALARGSFDLLIGSVYPRANVRDGRWYLGNCPDGVVTIDPGMVLVPIVGGPGWSFLGHRDAVVNDLAYALPRARRLANPELRAANGDALAALLGGPRAAILRSLDRPVTAGALAESLLLVPSVISHHVHTLEQAGLVRRRRAGRNVLVHRTPRGTSLINLYDS